MEGWTVAFGAPEALAFSCGEVIVAARDDEFEQFFISNYDSVLRALVLITGDREQATDAVQEAFIKAYARWGTIRSYDMPGAWVRRVAINASRDHSRSDRRRRRREEPHTPAVHDSPADAVLADSSAFDLLGRLPRRQREVATLHYVEDFGVADIAVMLGISEGTVKSSLADARARLRSLLGSDGSDG